jgi:hypothetical protein
MSTRLRIFQRPYLKVRKLRSDTHLLRPIEVPPPQDLTLQEALTNLKRHGTSDTLRIRKHQVPPLRKYDGTRQKFSEPIKVARPEDFGVQKGLAVKAHGTSTKFRVRKRIYSEGVEYDATRPKISQRTKTARLQDGTVQEDPTGLKNDKILRKLRITKHTSLKGSFTYLGPENHGAQEISTTSTITKQANLNRNGNATAVQQREGNPTFEPPIKIKRIRNLIIQKIPTEPTAVEPSVRADLPLSFKLKQHHSPSWYTIPTRDSTKLWKSMPMLDPVEIAPPPNLDDETPSERLERHVESAHAKTIHRDAWDARTRLVTLSISLLFSSQSQNRIEEFRKKYSPERKEWTRFGLANRLEVDKYDNYEDMLDRLTARWKPFSIQVNMPGRRLDHRRFRVGLQLASENLKPLEQELVGKMRKLHTSTQVRRMMRSREQLDMMVINGDITKFEDAIGLVEQLKQEYRKGIEDIKVEGLILHGRRGTVDTLFPPPKLFLFSGRETAGQESGTAIP